LVAPQGNERDIHTLVKITNYSGEHQKMVALLKNHTIVFFQMFTLSYVISSKARKRLYRSEFPNEINGNIFIRASMG